MRNFYIVAFIFVIGILLSVDLEAQIRRRLQYREHPTSYMQNRKYVSVGLFFGGLNYLGDLAPRNNIGSTSIPLTGPTFGVTGTYRPKRFLAIRTSLLWGRMKGDDATADKFDSDDRFRYTRNLHFRNDIKELSLDLVLDLAGHYRTFATRNMFTPYFFAGIAVFHHNPKARVPEVDALHYDIFQAEPLAVNDHRYAGVTPGEWIDLKPLGTEGQNLPDSEIKPYSNWQVAIPMGVGVRYRLSRQSDLVLEIGYRQTFTDYLDDVSTSFLNPDDFGEGPEANLTRLMHDRSKEPTHMRTGKVRDLEYILENVHGTSPYASVPAEFGGQPYDLIDGYGRAHRDNIRGKDAFDVYIVTKLTYTYIIGRGFGYKNRRYRPSR